MSKRTKRAEDLMVADLETNPVWEYTNKDGPLGETAVQPVARTPLENLNGRLVGTRIRLANGTRVWAVISNVYSNNPRATKHFLTLSVFNNGKCFEMARYHDIDRNEHGPKALAAFLELPLAAIFPISYDLSRFSQGQSAALVGTIPKEPEEELTDDQLVNLALQQ